MINEYFKSKQSLHDTEPEEGYDDCLVYFTGAGISNRLWAFRHYITLKSRTCICISDTYTVRVDEKCSVEI